MTAAISGLQLTAAKPSAGSDGGSISDGVQGGSNVITTSTDPTPGHARGAVGHALLQEMGGRAARASSRSS